ncbi:hypothetical protein CH333_01145 [candidate division WOR-3 bacterium JGI_Cruoil_03_44_89]|uniref:DRTGG domain-containing protein n=1 Tax=candidate division WOR-3 bacterium JGI_Cruoil_03_44_89 TaxID=1973748 RepID=A0A235BYP9_UNCW3|nr:MAG: hypothetical protein CH333_01145 [candidate division WOR-3 bacterium JGI_Cruoil_03_44_89]
MKKVGYFEGTDSTLLATLAVEGIDTLPLGNGEDGYGKYIGHITKGDNISLVVGYLHKVVPLAEMGTKPSDILYSCTIHKIPVVLLAPKQLHEKAKRVLGDIAEKVKLVDPKDALEEIMNILK